ncbi:HEAT repeat domain-containing protein [Ktedonospora formicarum]|uniref:HEAT repeat domain-containing protein n=1 Tax=Ktedonospora formicarum TaxID=2778364 RepID=A0A8J3HYD4_9CHLR|nr:HEAT repeat domain-containing protein [Ktedonospora formicarum]GHO42229.1 hypothetical protein KSX_03920 [Ktedonospora formicarum]
MTRSRVPFATLLTGLTDPDSQVRLQAIRNIMRRRSELAQAYPALLTLLNDSDDQVCKAAIKALGTLNDPHVFSALIPLLTHQSPDLRLLVLKTLAQLDYSQTIPYWFAARGDWSEFVRRAAYKAMNDTRAVEPLILMLNDTHIPCREYIARELGVLGDARAVKPLIAALGDTNTSVRYSAAEALGKLGDAQAIDPLITALDETDHSVRSYAISALSELGSARAVEPLIPLLNDENADVRRNVAKALGQLGDGRAIPPLRTLLTDPVGLVADQARQALARLKKTVEAIS